jgi:hypothetical protein
MAKDSLWRIKALLDAANIKQLYAQQSYRHRDKNIQLLQET